MTFLMGITLWTLIVVGGIKAWTDGGTTPLRVKLRVAAAILFAIPYALVVILWPFAPSTSAFDLLLKDAGMFILVWFAWGAVAKRRAARKGANV
jgi:hypothetical protein